MSVKDKIAMWNSMAVNPNPPQPNPAKLTVSDPHPKPKQQEKEKIVPKNLPSNLTQEPVHPPSLTFNFKKTQSTEQPPQNIPHHISQPSNLPQKGCEIVKPSEAKKQEKEAKNAPKFSDIKKQLETQTAGKGIYFTAPVAPPKKIEEQPANKATECEIQKDIPRFSVKQQAAKLAQFYQQKHMNQLKKNQQKQQAQVLHQHEKEPLPQSIHKEEPNTLNIVNQNMNSPPDHPKQKEQKQLPKPNITDHPSDPIDTTLRGKNKNKMKKQAFDDED